MAQHAVGVAGLEPRRGVGRVRLVIHRRRPYGLRADAGPVRGFGHATSGPEKPEQSARESLLFPAMLLDERARRLRLARPRGEHASVGASRASARSFSSPTLGRRFHEAAQIAIEPVMASLPSLSLPRLARFFGTDLPLSKISRTMARWARIDRNRKAVGGSAL